jgi:hypothetical protein
MNKYSLHLISIHMNFFKCTTVFRKAMDSYNRKWAVLLSTQRVNHNLRLKCWATKRYGWGRRLVGWLMCHYALSIKSFSNCLQSHRKKGKVSICLWSSLPLVILLRDNAHSEKQITSSKLNIFSRESDITYSHLHLDVLWKWEYCITAAH